MVAVYLIIGLLFLFTDTAIELFPMYRTPVGIVMLAYASFRGYTTYKKIENNESQA